MFSIRLHCEYIDSLSMFDSHPLFLVKETEANREHYQGIIKYDKQPASLRALIKKHNPRLQGNKAYSVVTCREEVENLITYYCKGDSEKDLPQVVVNTFGVEDIDGHHKQYWSVNRKIKEDNKKSLYDKCFGTTILNNPDAITSHAIRFFIDSGRPINTSQIQGLVMTYLCRNQEGYASRLKNRIVAAIEQL